MPQASRAQRVKRTDDHKHNSLKQVESLFKTSQIKRDDILYWRGNLEDLVIQYNCWRSKESPKSESLNSVIVIFNSILCLKKKTWVLVKPDFNETVFKSINKYKHPANWSDICLFWWGIAEKKG